MKNIIYIVLLFVSCMNINAARLTYTDNIVPSMSIEYGPGTVLPPGTEIRTEDCEIYEITMDEFGTITIYCETLGDKYTLSEEYYENLIGK